MSQVTALSVMALPGVVHSFSAKDNATKVLGGWEYLAGNGLTLQVETSSVGLQVQTFTDTLNLDTNK